jgi:hypothetical protein
VMEPEAVRPTSLAETKNVTRVTSACQDCDKERGNPLPNPPPALRAEHMKLAHPSDATRQPSSGLSPGEQATFRPHQVLRQRTVPAGPAGPAGTPADSEQALAQGRETLAARGSTLRRVGDPCNGEQAHERRGHGHLHGASDQNVSSSSDIADVQGTAAVGWLKPSAKHEPSTAYGRPLDVRFPAGRTPSDEHGVLRPVLHRASGWCAGGHDPGRGLRDKRRRSPRSAKSFGANPRGLLRQANVI